MIYPAVIFCHRTVGQFASPVNNIISIILRLEWGADIPVRLPDCVQNMPTRMSALLHAYALPD
jgi:hypothetical protein